MRVLSNFLVVASCALITSTIGKLLVKQRCKTLCSSIGGISRYTLIDKDWICVCKTYEKLTGAQFIKLNEKSIYWDLPMQVRLFNKTVSKREVVDPRNVFIENARQQQAQVFPKLHENLAYLNRNPDPLLNLGPRRILDPRGIIDPNGNPEPILGQMNPTLYTSYASQDGLHLFGPPMPPPLPPPPPQPAPNAYTGNSVVDVLSKLFNGGNRNSYVGRASPMQSHPILPAVGYRPENPILVAPKPTGAFKNAVKGLNIKPIAIKPIGGGKFPRLPMANSDSTSNAENQVNQININVISGSTNGYWRGVAGFWRDSLLGNKASNGVNDKVTPSPNDIVTIKPRNNPKINEIEVTSEALESASSSDIIVAPKEFMMDDIEEPAEFTSNEKADTNKRETTTLNENPMSYGHSKTLQDPHPHHIATDNENKTVEPILGQIRPSFHASINDNTGGGLTFSSPAKSAFGFKPLPALPLPFQKAPPPPPAPTQEYHYPPSGPKPFPLLPRPSLPEIQKNIYFAPHPPLPQIQKNINFVPRQPLPEIRKNVNFAPPPPPQPARKYFFVKPQPPPPQQQGNGGQASLDDLKRTMEQLKGKGISGLSSKTLSNAENQVNQININVRYNSSPGGYWRNVFGFWSGGLLGATAANIEDTTPNPAKHEKSHEVSTSSAIIVAPKEFMDDDIETDPDNPDSSD